MIFDRFFHWFLVSLSDGKPWKFASRVGEKQIFHEFHMLFWLKISMKNHRIFDQFWSKKSMKNQWKINEKINVYLGIDFSSIWGPFGTHLGSLWGPCWAVLASQEGAHHWVKGIFWGPYYEKRQKCHQHPIFDDLGVHFDAFWEVPGPLWGRIFGEFVERKLPNASQYCKNSFHYPSSITIKHWIEFSAGFRRHESKQSPHHYLLITAYLPFTTCCILPPTEY